MKKSLLFIFLLAGLFHSRAQPFTSVRWSDAVEPYPQHSQGIYGNTDLSLIVLTNRDRSFAELSLLGLDAKGKTMKLEYNLKEPAYHFIGAFVQKNQVLILLEFQHEQNGQFIQDVKALSFNESGLQGEKTLLTNESKNKNYLGKTRFAVSPDRKRCLVFVESPFRTGLNEEISTIVIDEDGKEENKVFSLDIESKQLVHNYPQLSNAGVVYFLKRDKDKNQQFHYLLFSYNPLTADLSHKAIAFSNTSISDIRGAITPQGEFLVGGFTSSENVHAYEGYFLMGFDQACMPKFKTQGQFDETSFLKFLSKKEYNKNPAIYNYLIDNITIAPSGRIYMAAEAYEEKKSEKESIYDYGSVMMVCFSASGDYYSTIKATKDQQADDATVKWTSYKTFFYKDTVVMLHNALTLKEPEPKFRETRVHEKFGALPVPAHYDFEIPDNMVFNPDLFLQEDSQHFTAVFSSADRKQFRLVKVAL